MCLQIRFGQVPQRWRPVTLPEVPVDCRQREWIVNGKIRSDFEACARAFIPKLIPTAYLEGYGQLMEKVNDLPWPSDPKLIWTSNAYNTDDMFKAWAAHKVECVRHW